jgi:hypothetical protein
MAIHGKNGRIYANEYDLSCYLSSAGLDRSIDTSETSVFCADSKRYIEGLKDATLSAEGVYDEDVDKIDKTLTDLEAGESIYSYYPGKDTAGLPGYGFRALKTATGFQVSVSEAVNFSLAGQTSEGVDRILSITPSALIEANGSTDSLDLGAGGVAGCVLYVHVTGLSDDATVKIEHSTDDSAWTTLHNYGTVATVGAYRTVKTGTLNRYIRVTIEDLGVGQDITIQAGIKKL